MSFLSDFTKKFFDKLQSLRDVNISSPQDGEALKYDSVTEKWINGTVSGGGTAELSSSAIINRYYENITTVKDTFNIEYSVVESQAYVDVWLNGVKLAPTEFTATDGTSVVLNTPVDGSVNPQEIEIVAAFAAGVDDVATSITRTVYRYTATEGQTSFEVSYSSKDDLDVYLNNHRLDADEFTATNGTSIVLNDPAVLNDSIVITAYKGVADSGETLYATKTDAKKLAIIFG